MKNIRLIPILLLMVLGCDKETNYLNTSAENFVYGNLQYYDVLNDKIRKDCESAQSTLVLENGTVYPSWSKLEVTGSEFIIGPVDTGEFQIHSEFISSEFGVSYSNTYTGEMDSTAEYIGTQTLQPTYNHTLLCEVKDETGSPMKGVSVYLYSNYTMLDNYRGNHTAALHVKQTNEKGRVLFTNLTANPHFIYAEKIIQLNEDEADTLHSFDPAFDPASVAPLSKTILNEFEITVN